MKMMKLLASPKRIATILGVLLLLALPLLLQTYWMLMFIPSLSMLPCLEPGDFLIGTRHPKQYERGDVLVFRDHDRQILIKRLIGLPGEEVILTEAGEVFVDGKLLEEPYVQHQATGEGCAFQVPDGKLLFLGDNRGGSWDARYWKNPYISTESIMAKATYKLLPEMGKLEGNEK